MDKPVDSMLAASWIVHLMFLNSAVARFFGYGVGAEGGITYIF